MAVAAELGYRPNSIARALRGSRSSLVGVIAQNITSRFHSQILRGLHDVAVKRAYRVFLGHVERNVNIAADYGSMFEQSHADGILIVGELQGDQEVWETLTGRHRYVVGVSDRTTRRSFPGVYSDSVLGSNLAMDHLWSLGHRNIICVTDPALQDGQLRADVYSRYMHEHGVAEHICIYLTPRTFESSTETGREIFSHFTRAAHPTAIFATTDAIAIGLLQAAYQTGVSVPQQISLVGFDDIEYASVTIPPLTTIRQSGFEMGQAAANLLLDMIEQERERSEIDDVVLTPSLVVRQSTAARPSA